VTKETESVSDNMLFKRKRDDEYHPKINQKMLYTTGRNLPTFYPSNALEINVK